MSRGNQSLAPADFLRLLPATSAHVRHVQDKVSGDQLLDLEPEQLLGAAWTTRPECLGKHADRKDGQRGGLHVHRLRPVLPDAVLDKYLLCHLRLHYLPANYQRDPQTVLCIYGTHPGLDGPSFEHSRDAGAHRPRA